MICSPPGRPWRVFRRKPHPRGPHRSHREINHPDSPGPSLRGGQKIIDGADFISLGQCACRATLKRCDNPTEVCLFFDAPARFLVEKKYARRTTCEEAHSVLESAEEEGLVHTSTNTSDRVGFICNCCRRCCVILRGRTELNLPHPFAPSAFLAEVKAAACIGCGLCADDRCPVNAIDMNELPYSREPLLNR